MKKSVDRDETPKLGEKDPWAHAKKQKRQNKTKYQVDMVERLPKV